jgi:hypothetical protein
MPAEPSSPEEMLTAAEPAKILKDLIAHVKEIGTVRIELICPQMRAGIGINELGNPTEIRPTD